MVCAAQCRVHHTMANAPNAKLNIRSSIANKTKTKINEKKKSKTYTWNTNVPKQCNRRKRLNVKWIVFRWNRSYARAEQCNNIGKTSRQHTMAWHTFIHVSVGAVIWSIALAHSRSQPNHTTQTLDYCAPHHFFYRLSFMRLPYVAFSLPFTFIFIEIHLRFFRVSLTMLFHTIKCVALILVQRPSAAATASAAASSSCNRLMMTILGASDSLPPIDRSTACVRYSISKIVIKLMIYTINRCWFVSFVFFRTFYFSSKLIRE